MQVGSFMGQVFQVSDRQVYTLKNLAGSTGSDWATHEIIGGKARSQWIGPKLRSYTFDVTLRAQDGIRPRTTLARWQQAAESPEVDYLVIGGVPLSPYPFKLKEVSDEWNTVMSRGELAECKVSLTVEEYL